MQRYCLFLVNLFVATGKNCRRFCTQLNGFKSTCVSIDNQFVCTKGGQPCGGDLCSVSPTRSPAVSTVSTSLTIRSLEASAESTQSSVESTATVPTSVPTLAESSVPGCGPKGALNLFVWGEWPAISAIEEAATYYNKLAAFVQSNCVGASVPRLVLRILNPTFPTAGSSIWWPPSSSPLYSSLIATLPAGTELVLYPYIMDPSSGSSWMSFGTGSPDPVSGAWQFMKDWNIFLSSVGSASKFVGTVIDLEETPRMATYNPLIISPTFASSLKGQYGNELEFGVSAGFDQPSIINAGYDKVYIQLYDFYSPVAYVDSTANSPFLLNLNNPSEMVNYVLNAAVASSLLDVYSANTGSVMAMWSTQNLAGNCIYPESNGFCGINNEFGSWSAAEFSNFISQLQAKSSVFAQLKHGIFQFSYTPTSWL